MVSPPCLLLLPLPLLLVLLTWKGHTQKAHQTRGLCLIGQGDRRQLGCYRYRVRRGWGEECERKWWANKEWRSARRGCLTARLMDGGVCKGWEQESGFWQTQHPAADISGPAAMESHSAQWQPSMETPPSSGSINERNSNMCPTGQTVPNESK